MGAVVIYAIFDTETTGLILPSQMPLERQPRIIEFAGVHLDSVTWEITREFVALYNPGVALSPKITKITGLRDGDLEGKGSFDCQDILDFFAGADRAVAHNFTFDHGMLEIEFLHQKYDLNIPAFDAPLCTVEKTEHLTGSRLTLGKLHAYLFGDDFKGAHRALVDVKALAKIVQALTEKGLFP
jgi:DNA polymerase III epsilon subunit-like protein